MKGLLLAILAIFTFFDSKGQAIIKTFKPQGWPMAAITSIMPTLDGGLAIAGGVSDTFPTYHTTMFLMKLDSSFNLIWSKQYNSGHYYDNIRKLDISSDSGFLLICDYTTNLFDPYGFAIIKTDSKGNFLWEKTYPGLEDAVYLKTSDAGYILGGNTAGSGHTIMGLTKIDSAFTLQWSYAYASSDTIGSAALSIKETTDHGFIIAGELLSLSDKYDAILLLKTDSLGMPIWSKSYNGTDFDGGEVIILNSDSGFTMGGFGSALDSIGDIVNGELLMKTDKVGNLLWGNIYDEFMSAQHVEKSVDGGYYVYANLAVSKTDSLGNLQWTKSYNAIPEFPISYDDVYAYYQADTNNFIFCGAIGVVENEQAFFMKTTSQSDSCTYLINNIATYPYNPTVNTITFTLTAQYGQDTVVSVSSDLIFTDSILCGYGVYTSVQHFDSSFKNQMVIYPNPATNELFVLDNSLTDKSEIIIYNVLGVKCIQSSISNTQSEIDISGLASGVYFVRVSDRTHCEALKFMKE